MKVSRSRVVTAVAVSACTVFIGSARAGDDPFADIVIDFDAGSNGAGGFDNPNTALGSPERFTGEGVFPSVVSPFSPPFGTDEIVSIGTGGFLTVQFNSPIVNDPLNPFGIDFIVFSNTGFIDQSFPNGIVGGVFGNDGGSIEVSANGSDWVEVPNTPANGLFPTIGYLDAGPYDNQPGSVPSDFTKPLDPSLAFGDFNGLTYADVLALYDGSGGGTGIDIGALGLDQINFVRILNTGQDNIEIDAFADVRAIPAPGALALLGLGTLALRRRRR